MATNLFVGGLPYSTTDDELRDLFASFGAVSSAKVIFDRETNRSKGFGFVEMDNADEAQEAIKQLHDSDFGGRKIAVNEAHPKEARPPRGNGGGMRERAPRNDGGRRY